MVIKSGVGKKKDMDLEMDELIIGIMTLIQMSWCK